MPAVQSPPQRRAAQRPAPPDRRTAEPDGLQARALQLQQAMGNRAFARVIQRDPVDAEPMKTRSVEKGIKIAPEGQLEQTVKLPQGTIPPGAEKTPDFVHGLFDADHHAFRLDEIENPPKE